MLPYSPLFVVAVFGAVQVELPERDLSMQGQPAQLDSEVGQAHVCQGGLAFLLAGALIFNVRIAAPPATQRRNVKRKRSQ